MTFPLASDLGSAPPPHGSFLLIDLQGYSEKIAVTSDIIGEGAAKLLQSKIQSYWLSVEEEFEKRLDKGWAYRLRQPGDGALYLFQRAVDAEVFAVGVCKQAQLRNHKEKINDVHSLHLFRAGIATGDIEWVQSGGEWIWCGPTANRPSRLEASARTGEVVIDRETYESIPDAVKVEYAGPEIIEVKGERHTVFRRAVDRNAVEAHSIREATKIITATQAHASKHASSVPVNQSIPVDQGTGIPSSVSPPHGRRFLLMAFGLLAAILVTSIVIGMRNGSPLGGTGATGGAGSTVVTGTFVPPKITTTETSNVDQPRVPKTGRPKKEGVRELAMSLGSEVRKKAASLQHQAVRLGLFTQTGGDFGQGGGAIVSELEHVLTGFIDPGATLEVIGHYSLRDDPEKNTIKAIHVTAKLLDTRVNQEVSDFAFSHWIRANSDIAEICGANVRFREDKDYDKPSGYSGDLVKDRNRDILDSLPLPDSSPKRLPVVQAWVEGSFVKARQDARCAVQIRAKPENDIGGAKPILPAFERGLPFVPIEKTYVYEVVVQNSSSDEVAVSLTIDGIDQFAFSEDRVDEIDDDGKHVQKPRFTHWMLGPSQDGMPSELVIPGWHKTADPKRKDNIRSFLVTDYGLGASSKFPTKAVGKMGMITVGISRCYPAGTIRSGGETGFGPDLEKKQEVVRRVVDPPCEFITLRYLR